MDYQSIDGSISCACSPAVLALAALGKTLWRGCWAVGATTRTASQHAQSLGDAAQSGDAAAAAWAAEAAARWADGHEDRLGEEED
nr:unnamed protein product [Digitaria exilis]CAB3500611.1 unnamed protein product [Digitaria exilis]